MTKKIPHALFGRPSIYIYVALFLVIGLISLGSITGLALSQLDDIRVESRKKNKDSAKAELDQALNKLSRMSNKIITSFAEWEETLQHFHNPTYYNYWRESRVQSVNFLPSFFAGVELYSRKGKPLGSVNDDEMPRHVDELNNHPVLVNGDVAYVVHCNALRTNRQGEAPYGYICIKLDLLAGIKDIERYNHLDTNNLSLIYDGEKNIPLNDVSAHMKYSVQSNYYVEVLDELVLKTLMMFFVFGAGILFIFAWILIVPIGMPIRRLSSYIDNMSVREGITSKTNQNRLVAIAEIEKAYSSLDDFHVRLEQSSRKLRESEEYFRSLIENSSDVITILDLDGLVHYCSPSIKRVLKYDSDEVINHSILDFVHSEDLEGIRIFLQAMGDDPNIHFLPEFRFRDKNGGWCVLEAIGQPLRHENDDTKIIVNSRDITERKRVSLELAKAHDDALEASRAKSKFLANISHELKTPLNAVMGYSQLILVDVDDIDKPDLESKVTAIYEAGSHLLSLINEVLDISKIEAGKIELHPQNFDVIVLVQETIATVVPMMEHNENSYNVTYSSGLGEMHSDRVKIKQILLNILSNAAKFTQGGNIDINVLREKNNGGDYILFVVSDTGPGMTAAHIDKIFDSFYQVDSSSSRMYNGTGLGLAITKMFCELLGGKVNVVSEPGKGSIFSVQLPVLMPGQECQGSRDIKELS